MPKKDTGKREFAITVNTVDPLSSEMFDLDPIGYVRISEEGVYRHQKTTEEEAKTAMQTLYQQLGQLLAAPDFTVPLDPRFEREVQRAEQFRKSEQRHERLKEFTLQPGQVDSCTAPLGADLYFEVSHQPPACDYADFQIKKGQELLENLGSTAAGYRTTYHFKAYEPGEITISVAFQKRITKDDGSKTLETIGTATQTVLIVE
jgi:hypothetical protein